MFYRENFCNLHIIVGVCNALSWDNAKVFRLVHIDESVLLYVAICVRALVTIFFFIFSLSPSLSLHTAIKILHVYRLYSQEIQFAIYRVFLFRSSSFSIFHSVWKFHYTFGVAVATLFCTVCIDAIAHFTVFIRHTLLTHKCPTWAEIFSFFFFVMPRLVRIFPSSLFLLLHTKKTVYSF